MTVQAFLTIIIMDPRKCPKKAKMKKLKMNNKKMTPGVVQSLNFVSFTYIYRTKSITYS